MALFPDSRPINNISEGSVRQGCIHQVGNAKPIQFEFLEIKNFSKLTLTGFLVIVVQLTYRERLLKVGRPQL